MVAAFADFAFPFHSGKVGTVRADVANGRAAKHDTADLSDSDLDAIQGTLHTVTDPEFQARVGDVLWLRRKDFKAARMAVAAYIEAGSRLEDPERWPACMERYERGLRLARQIDAKGDLPKSVLEHLEARVRHYDGQDPLFFTCKALEFLAEFQFGDFPALAEIAGRVAAKSSEGGDFRRRPRLRLLQDIKGRQSPQAFGAACPLCVHSVRKDFQLGERRLQGRLWGKGQEIYGVKSNSSIISV